MSHDDKAESSDCDVQDSSVTNFTCLRPAISFPIAVFSVSDKTRAASGKINSSSIRKCSWYIAARLATELRNSAISLSDNLLVERYCAPRRSTLSCKRMAQR